MGAGGPKKHLKRMFAPSHWMLDKLKGRWAPKPSAGPHKMRECMPLIVMLRERLKYALTYRGGKKIVKEEASYKLCRVKKIHRGPKGIPYAITHDGRTLRYPDPDVKANDTVRVDIATGKILDYVKFEAGNSVMISSGNNMGRVGVISHRERHPGSFEIVHIKDAVGHTFATRLQNVFVIGKGSKPWISLPKGNGIKLSII